MKNEKTEEIKLILLGESGVGKTSIIKRFLYNEFNPIITTSVTMNFAEKEIYVDEKRILLNIWDTIGQEKYRSLSKLFLNETEIIILVYSITDPRSFEELSYWNKLYKEHLGDKTILGIVGNKSDLISEEKVTEKQGREYAKQNNAIFTLLSAKDNKNGINDFFKKLVSEYLDRKYNRIRIEDFVIIEDRKKGIVLDNKTIKSLGYKEEGCCGGNEKARKKRYSEILKKNNGTINCIFFGDIGVGKTSLIKRINGNHFDENEKHTEDLNTYETQYSNSTMEFNLKIYDINNEQKKSKKIDKIIIKSQIYFLVYDINNSNTLKEVTCMTKIIENCKNEVNNNWIIVIIANKKDLSAENKLNDNDFEIIGGEEQGEILAKKNNALFFKTTAKEDKEIKDIIGIAVEKLIALP